uniref:Uncharacterized protein n=1 Tax=Triticum urartu TaxID=4572 RepID=A0A8R7U4H9_TRIUA
MFVVSARGWINPHSFFSPARCAGKLTRRISRRSSNDELRRHLRSPGRGLPGERRRRRRKAEIQGREC